MRTRHSAFSLVELLVAVAVMLLVVFMLSQIFSITSSAIRTGTERSDAFSISRMALDRMRLDWRQAVPMNAHSLKWDKLPGNDAISLTAGVPAASGTRRQLSQVNHSFSDDHSGLLRASVGLNYYPADPTPESNPHLLGTERYSPPPPAAFEEFAASIIRLELAFLVVNTGGELTWRAAEPVDPEEHVRAVCIALVALDRQTGKNISQGEAVALAAAFPDATDDADLASVWTSLAQESQSIAASSGVPQHIASKLRVFHRLYIFSPHAS